MWCGNSYILAKAHMDPPCFAHGSDLEGSRNTGDLSQPQPRLWGRLQPQSVPVLRAALWVLPTCAEQIRTTLEAWRQRKTTCMLSGL